MRRLTLALSGALAACGSAQPLADPIEVAAFARNDLQVTKFRSAQADLNGDGRNEAVVYAMDSAWCGTGGCTLFVLSPAGSTYRIVGRIPAARLPIRLLDASHKGWRDLAVTVSGGAEVGPYVVRLPFDGERYPRTAFGPPATALNPVEGEILLAPSAL